MAIGFLPTNFNRCVSLAVAGHAAWAANLALQYAMGHFQLEQYVGVAPFAVNVAMVPSIGMHLGALYVYLRRPDLLSWYLRGPGLFINCFCFTFTLALDIAHGWSLFGFDARTIGLADFEHGVYAASGLQVAINFMLYALYFAGEIPMQLGWTKVVKMA